MNSISLQTTIVFLKLVFGREIFVFSSPIMAATPADVTSCISAAVGLISLFISLFVWRFALAAERGARERHQYTVQKDEQALLFKGLEALHRGEDLNLAPWRPFFDLVIKCEAAEHARARRGHAVESIFERCPEATMSWRPGANTGKEQREQRESGAERSSYQQTPASHHGSPRRRLTRSKSASPVKPQARDLLGLQLGSKESLGLQSWIRRAGDGDLPDH
jgi:hypothetical protein